VRTVLITGTSSGMGRELALQFAERGWNVAATMRDLADADPAFADREQVLVLPLDVTAPATIDAAVAAAVSRFGRIDVLVNNAGYAQTGTLEEVSADQLRAQYETNVFGAVSVTKAVLPQMRVRRAGHIIMTSSMGGQVSLPTMTVYTSSKFALEGISEGLAKEVRPLGINVTIVEPAGFTTPFFQKLHMPGRELPDYEPARQAMTAFGKTSVRGNLRKSMAAVVDIAGTDSPPLRLALGTFGLTMVREKMQSLQENYAAWEDVTRATD
jgi:NAD(P)-dependent dehydrogenase (short-subunit alcohol dehydrogenase family)